MQFQFRAGDQGASTYVPPSSSAPDRTARPIIGDLRRGSEYRVTEELLAAHEIMRRDIEAQLRRELMIERESEIIRASAGLAFFQPIAILIQPFGLENGLNMMDRVLHCSPFPGFKDSEILASMGGVHRDSTVTKPLRAPSVSMPVGIKRKTEAADHDQAPLPRKTGKTEREKKESADGDQAPSPNKKEKTENKWICTLCQVRATCEKGLGDHFQGKKHKAKEAALRKSAEKSQISEPNPPCPGGDKGKSQLKEKGDTSFWCPICETGTNSRAIMETHLKGKKHLAKLRNKSRIHSLNDAQEAREMTATEKDVLSSNAERTEEIETKKEDMEEGGEKPAAANKKQTRLKFWCQTCKIGTTSEEMMKEHQNGRKHMALLRKHGGALIVQTYGEPTLQEEMNDPVANADRNKGAQEEEEEEEEEEDGMTTRNGLLNNNRSVD